MRGHRLARLLRLRQTDRALKAAGGDVRLGPRCLPRVVVLGPWWPYPSLVGVVIVNANITIPSGFSRGVGGPAKHHSAQVMTIPRPATVPGCQRKSTFSTVDR